MYQRSPIWDHVPEDLGINFLHDHYHGRYVNRNGDILLLLIPVFGLYEPEAAQSQISNTGNHIGYIAICSGINHFVSIADSKTKIKELLFLSLLRLSER